MITPGKELCAYIAGQRNGHPADRFRYADFCGASFPISRLMGTDSRGAPSGLLPAGRLSIDGVLSSMPLLDVSDRVETSSRRLGVGMKAENALRELVAFTLESFFCAPLLELRAPPSLLHQEGQVVDPIVFH